MALFNNIFRKNSNCALTRKLLLVNTVLLYKEYTYDQTVCWLIEAYCIAQSQIITIKLWWSSLIISWYCHFCSITLSTSNTRPLLYLPSHSQILAHSTSNFSPIRVLILAMSPFAAHSSSSQFIVHNYPHQHLPFLADICGPGPERTRGRELCCNMMRLGAASVREIEKG